MQSQIKRHQRHPLRPALAVPLLVLLATGLDASAESSHVKQITINECTEDGLDSALAEAKAQKAPITDSKIDFACDGTINVTNTKVITGIVRLSAVSRHVTLRGNNAIQVIKISAKSSLTLDTVTVTGGETDGLGGGIYNQGGLYVSDSMFSQNKHGIVNFGSLTVEETTFADNHGDGIYNNGTLIVDSSTFARNRHGIDNASGNVMVANSTFSDNTAPPGQVGGAIANGGTLSVISSTFSGNRAPAGGGAIANRFNSKGSVQNTIIANGGHDPNCWGTTFDLGHNLQFPGTTCGSTIPVADPKLLPLADNGGPTQTMALPIDSPAVGKGDLEVCSGSTPTGI